jgi:Glyoxalase-like domain
MLEFDHIAVSARTLDEGTRAVEAALGVTLSAIGHHAHMGTHNRLLGLGPDLYLEVIAIDPDAPGPAWPRWFDLDRFTGPPRITNWVCRTDDLDAALAAAPDGAGTATPLSRGDFRWRFGIPATGALPFADTFPALIEWQGDLHPAQRLPDQGIRLARFDVTYPEADALRAALPLTDPRVTIAVGPNGFRATFDTPNGPKELA